MPRIVQCCENEVLAIINRAFVELHWAVRALVFDGLVVEPPPRPGWHLPNAMAAAERACKARGWDVRLLEKELHGKQSDPVQAIVDAHSVVALCRNLVGVHPNAGR